MKKFFNKKFIALIFLNFLIAAILIVGFLWFLFSGINSYTEHGIYETVPDLREARFEEAEILLKQQQLNAKIIDSVYHRDKALGTIVEQIPLPGASIKHNRPVYLIINSRQVKKVELPPINDISLRQATTALYAKGLNVLKVEYAPSEYKDLVLDVIYQGESVFSGYPIPEGDSLLLVVGAGLDFATNRVPNLRGLTLEEARQIIISSSFVVGATDYNYQSEVIDNTYLIYQQEPLPGETIAKGTAINIWLSNDHNLLNKAEKQEEQDKEEEFF